MRVTLYVEDYCSEGNIVEDYIAVRVTLYVEDYCSEGDIVCRGPL